jgi:hypothetical protein
MFRLKADPELDWRSAGDFETLLDVNRSGFTGTRAEQQREHADEEGGTG